MKHNHKALRKLFLILFPVLPILAIAGNIPQYDVTKGALTYSEMTGGTPLSEMQFNGNAVMFADRSMFIGEERSAKGFPIGFDFRMGGKVFDQFAISNNGNIYLGKGEVGYNTTAFRIGMATIAFGLYKAEVSYKTEGAEGERVLTVQYKNAVLNETGKNRGKYHLQIRLYEADGRIEIAFKEVETCYSKLGGFATGLRGWDDDDTLLLTAPGLEKPFTISTKKKADMLESDSYVNWDSDDYDQDYSPVFVFTPASLSDAPKGVPDLEVKQQDNNILISCRRARDAKATVILVSDSPFTEADLPVDGETFPAGQDKKGRWITKIGNSTAVYYGNDREVNLTFPGIEANKKYYICAISANGYPAYNVAERAEELLHSSQNAPEELIILPNSQDEISIRCVAEFPVIIASTVEALTGFSAGYTGLFGQPAPDVEPGDEIPGGGLVIYVGEPGSINVNVLPNQLTYFRAWTLDGDRVSATATDGTGIAVPSFPYEPGIENYPRNTPLWGWESSDVLSFVPVNRPYDSELAIHATSNNKEVWLNMPYFTSYRDMALTFDFAMETEREAAPSEEGQVLLQGYEPGKFGTAGYFQVRYEDEILKEIKEYNGTMTPVVTGGYEDGSSTFEPVEVMIPATGQPQKITLAFFTPTKSRLYLRNLCIVQTGEAPPVPELAPLNLMVAYEEGGEESCINVTADKADDAHGTLLLLSEDDFDSTPEDGRKYIAGNQLGNATVIYCGNEEHIEILSIPVEEGKEYVVTGFSYNPEGCFGKSFATVRLINTVVESLIENRLDSDTMIIHNVAGIRININSFDALPPGLYIINGRKVIK